MIAATIAPDRNACRRTCRPANFAPNGLRIAPARNTNAITLVNTPPVITTSNNNASTDHIRSYVAPENVSWFTKRVIGCPNHSTSNTTSIINTNAGPVHIQRRHRRIRSGCIPATPAMISPLAAMIAGINAATVDPTTAIENPMVNMPASVINGHPGCAIFQCPQPRIVPKTIPMVAPMAPETVPYAMTAHRICRRLAPWLRINAYTFVCRDVATANTGLIVANIKQANNR